MVVIDIYALIFGLGLGFNMQTLVLAIQNAVPPQDMGVATSSATFFRQMGGTLGTAVFLSVLFSSLTGNIKNAFTASAKTPQFQAALNDPSVLTDPANKIVLQALKSGQSGTASVGGNALNDSSFINHMDARLARPFLVGFANSIDLVFLLGAVVLLVAFVVVWFLPEEKLRTQSGIEARQSQENAANAVAAEELVAAAAALGEGAAAEALPAEDGPRSNGASSNGASSNRASSNRASSNRASSNRASSNGASSNGAAADGAVPSASTTAPPREG